MHCLRNLTSDAQLMHVDTSKINGTDKSQMLSPYHRKGTSTQAGLRDLKCGQLSPMSLEN